MTVPEYLGCQSLSSPLNQIDCLATTLLVFIFLKITPKHQRSDAGYLGLPQRSCKTLIPPLSEKVNVLNFKRKEKKSNTVVAKIYSKNEPSIPEIVKKEKEICFSFALAPQSAKVMATLRDKCSVKMEKALHS